jgi:hypothetical protein
MLLGLEKQSRISKQESRVYITHLWQLRVPEGVEEILVLVGMILPRGLHPMLPVRNLVHYHLHYRL